MRKLPCRQLFRTFLGCVLLAGGVVVSAAARDLPLVQYVERPDESFSWKTVEERELEGVSAARLECVSQTWRGNLWTHQLLVVRPPQLRHPDMAFFFITGDGPVERQINFLKKMALRAGAVAAVINRVPNQPLYDGKKEDALIAYSFNQYIESGDPTWPVLFPMVKSAARGMDAVQEYVRKATGKSLQHFVVAGASKRGWTTWLTAAADKRVIAIAPMVIDMLNMKAQSRWAETMYGRQSEQIKDYTDLDLIARMDEPRMVELRALVDPYSYRARYRMPKLLLLGTDDPYWVVDSLRHYWGDLPSPKLVFQTPNGGHDLAGGEQASETLATFFQMVADHERLPTMTWRFHSPAPRAASIDTKLDRPASRFRLWTALSPIRDFRDATWTSEEIAAEDGGRRASAQVSVPAMGFRAYLLEAELTAKGGEPYRLSTEARVLPDGPPGKE